MKTRPRKAFLLAAGFGTRMLPLTRDLPKPLMPVWNVPAIEHTLAMLRRWGVTDVLVNLHHRSDRMLDHLRAPRTDGLRIQISFEPGILGTGGALRRAEWFFAGRDPVWVLNADVVADLNPGALLRAYRPGRTIAVAWVHPSLGPRTVDVRRGAIVNFRSRRAGARGTCTFCGLQLVNPRLLDKARRYVPSDTCFFSLIEAYERAMAAGWKIAGVSVKDAFWADVGTPQQYLDAHRELFRAHRAHRPGARLVSSASVRRMTALRRSGVRIQGFAAISESAAAARGARMHDSVVWDGAVLARSASVECAVIGRGTSVRGNVSYLALPAEQAFDNAELDALRAYGWNPRSCTALPLGPRGSARTFTRVRRGTRDLMLVRYEASRAENTLYVGHTRFLARIGIPVPRVLLDCPGDCVTLFEDLGHCPMEAWTRGRPEADVRRLYHAILDAVLVMHERGARAARRARLKLVPSFRPVLYRWERNYFAEHMLRRRMKMPAADIARIKRELAGVARKLQRTPRVLVHRDLQSSNILLHRGRPYFIDFQGMRYGPAAYDLASLLCDPYVELSDDLRDELVAYYAARCATPGLVRELFWCGAVQRLAQALGAYARLGSDPDTRYFTRYIPPALRMMRRAAGRVPGLTALRAWCEAVPDPG